MTGIQTWRFITLMLASLNLSPSMAHLLEMPQRLKFDLRKGDGDGYAIKNIYRC